MKYLMTFEGFDKYKPIGFIDSGYGGLAILTEVRKSYPDLDTVFLGVSPNTTLSKLDSSTVVDLTMRGLDYLSNLGCVVNIIACNTACSQLDNFPNMTINLISETINSMSKMNWKKLAILATEKTISSGQYNVLNDSIGISCPEWASLVESLEFLNNSGRQKIEMHLANIFLENPDIDTILLACTHYILLKPLIIELYPNINVISQDTIVCDLIPSISGISQLGSCRYLTLGDNKEFDVEANQLLSIDVESEMVTI